ncbi:MAG: DUF1844 domain-containing protein [Deltaproteobacteria bacterium]|nr:DUF1844 domain-containing protein [Deltaproteobacteria bacterium]
MEEKKQRYTVKDKRGQDPEDGGEKVAGKNTDPQKNDKLKQPESLPKIDFATLVMSFASAAIINMGKVPDPMTGQVQQNFGFAQQNIDIIALLKEKTKGNVSEEEEKMMDKVLYELRLEFVEAKKGN